MMNIPKWLDIAGKTPPKWLTCCHARKFWRDHAPHLIESNALNEQNIDTFALVCEVWGLMRDADKSERQGRIFYLGLLKQFQSLIKTLTPKEQEEDIASILREGMVG